MLSSRRRIVTGHNAQGKSVIVIDGPPGNLIERDAGGLAEIWNTDGGAVDSRDAVDRASGPVQLSPPTGGSVRVRTAAARSWNRCTMASRSSSGLDTAQPSSGDSDGSATGPTAGSSVTSSTSSGGSMVGIRSSRSSPSSSKSSAVVGG